MKYQCYSITICVPYNVWCTNAGDPEGEPRERYQFQCFGQPFFVEDAHKTLFNAIYFIRLIVSTCMLIADRGLCLVLDIRADSFSE